MEYQDDYENIPLNGTQRRESHGSNRPSKWTVITIVCVFVVAVVIGGTYYNRSSSSSPTPSQSSSAPAPAPVDESLSKLTLMELHDLMYEQMNNEGDAYAAPILRQKKKSKHSPNAIRKRILDHVANPFNNANETASSLDINALWSDEGSNATVATEAAAEAARSAAGPSSIKHHAPHAIEDKDLQDAVRFFHISDTHVDPFFAPLSSMQPGVCHSCRLSTAVLGSDAYCPLILPADEFTRSLPGMLNSTRTLMTAPGTTDRHALLGYAFGRYRCNPPPRLMSSLLNFLHNHNSNPDFMVFTGDLAPHGYPDDNYPVTADTKLKDLCPTKFLVMERHLREIRHYFPKTPIAFAMGNNDHLPKNTFWPPYIHKLAGLLVQWGILDPKQRSSFEACGSHYVDLERGDLKLRVLLPDLTLLAPGGEATFPPEVKSKKNSDDEETDGDIEDELFPARAALVKWLSDSLASAREQGRVIVWAGHQPLQLKKSRDELLLGSIHGRQIKALLSEYADSLTIALAGHRNLAGMGVLRGAAGQALAASVTVPGVSPRANNNPCFHEMFLDAKDGRVREVQQYLFDLMEQNEAAMDRARASVHGTAVTDTGVDERDSAGRVWEQAVADAKGREEGEVLVEEDGQNADADAAAEAETEAVKADSSVLKTPSNPVQAAETTPKPVNATEPAKASPSNPEEPSKLPYLGSWVQHGRELYSWRALSGSDVLDAPAMEQFLATLPYSSRRFVALQVWKQAGFAGQETPENVRCAALHDREDAMMRCLFPEQDERCFANSWLK